MASLFSKKGKYRQFRSCRKAVSSFDFDDFETRRWMTTRIGQFVGRSFFFLLRCPHEKRYSRTVNIDRFEAAEKAIVSSSHFEIFSRRSWTIFLSFCIIDFNFLLKISPRWSISVNKIYINYRMFNVIQLLHYPQKEISFTLPRRRDDEPHSWEKKKINIRARIHQLEFRNRDVDRFS